MTQAEATRQISFIQAINEALRQELQRDPSVIVMGEDIRFSRCLGWAYEAHKGSG